MSEYTLYGLRELGTENIRYVGITTQNISFRLKQHLRKPIESNSHKYNWFQKLRREGKLPEIFPLAVGLTKEEAVELEIHLISELPKIGYSLINVSAGGESGMLGRKISEEARRKMSLAKQGRRMMGGMTGKTHTKETREKLRANHIGKKRPDSEKRKISIGMLGRKLPRETHDLINSKNRGQKRTHEQIARIKKGQQRAREESRCFQMLAEMWR